jgi:hypothetical protein
VNELLAESVLNSRDWFKRYLKGFDDSTLTVQPPGLPNHCAWTLGHLAVTMGRATERLGGPRLPEDEFVKGNGRSGDSRRFDTESVSFGSTPVADLTLYPAIARAVEIFDNACARLAATVREAPEGVLAREVDWGAAKLTGRQLAVRMVFHNGTHAGELADIRRAMKFASIFA